MLSFDTFPGLALPHETDGVPVDPVYLGEDEERGVGVVADVADGIEGEPGGRPSSGEIVGGGFPYDMQCVNAVAITHPAEVTSLPTFGRAGTMSPLANEPCRMVLDSVDLGHMSVPEHALISAVERCLPKQSLGCVRVEPQRASEKRISMLLESLVMSTTPSILPPLTAGPVTSADRAFVVHHEGV